MNPLEKALSWIEIMLHPASGLRQFKVSKHAGAKRLSPKAQKLRRLLNKRQRQARQGNYRRARS